MGPRLAAAGSPRSERQRKNKHLVWAYGIDHMTTLRCPSHMIPHHGSTTTACRCMWPGQRGGGKWTRHASHSAHAALVIAAWSWPMCRQNQRTRNAPLCWPAMTCQGLRGGAVTGEHGWDTLGCHWRALGTSFVSLLAPLCAAARCKTCPCGARTRAHWRRQGRGAVREVSGHGHPTLQAQHAGVGARCIGAPSAHPSLPPLGARRP